MIHQRIKCGPLGLMSLQRDRGRPYMCDSPSGVKISITALEALEKIDFWSLAVCCGTPSHRDNEGSNLSDLKVYGRPRVI